ncbi:MAG: histidine kinase [Chitinophagaceae bacterium]|nr:histidine kinase [Chitinophagaceae bacterium]
MWFGTPDGLCRYDGSVLTSYKYYSYKEPINNFIRGKIQEDNKGNIWYCNETGIYKWDALTHHIVKVFAFGKQYFNSDFSGIQLDEQGNLWLLNILFGVCRFNIKSNQFTLFPLPGLPLGPNIQYSFFTSDNEGNLWLRVVKDNEAFLKFNRNSHIFTYEFEKDPPHAIFFDKQKKVLAYEDKLILYYNGKPQPVIIPKFIDGKKVSFFSFSVLADSHNRVWMTARGGGLFYYNENDGTFHEYHHDNSKIKSLPFDLTTCLFIDRSDNLWIGIDGGGVAKIDLKQPKFNLFPLSEGDYPVLRDYFTKCFFEDNKGRIWFGSHNNGFSIYQPLTGGLINYKNQPGNSNSLPGNSVASIFKDSKGNMWIGTNAGIAIFNETSASFKSILIRNLPSLQLSIKLFIYKFIGLKNGDFLAATSLGLVRVALKKSGRYEGLYYGGKNFLLCTSTDVIEMDDSSIFVTMPNSGLYHLKPTKKDFDSLKVFFTGLDLRSIRRDDKRSDIVWIGSGKGLIEFNTATEQSITWDESKGLANSYVYGSLEDEKHNLWISTNGGLSYLDRKTNHIENFSYQDGLQSNEFNTQALYKSSTNTFYFGGIKGFNWFRSQSFAANTFKPQVAITQIEIDNVPFAFDSALLVKDNIQLPYDRNNLSFRFAALDYTRPEANKIKYKLENWDEKWITTYDRSVRYSKLPPGNYTMIVKASNAAGVWSDEKKINIVIQSPFWKRMWFIIVLTLLLLAAIIFITYSISQQKAKRKLRLLENQIVVDAERNRISTDMHDEIGSGITRIALLSELIQTQNKEDKELKKDINRIATSARGLVQTMSEIIWALNPQNDTLENLLAYIREQSHQYFEPLEMQFDIDFPEEVPDIKLSNAERRNLYLVTREALSNALKHAGASTLQLKLEINKKEYCFTVADNGTGMSKKKDLQGHNGIRNMKKRMDDIGGTVEWLPLEKGTAVVYCLPV